MRAAAVALAGALVGAAPLSGQESRLGFAVAAADSILSTPGESVSLEAFRGDEITGVYLHGEFGGEPESVAYGSDPQGQRYVWFSVAQGDSIKHVVMLMDVDLDVSPDFLLFRTIDEAARVEVVVEYRAPATRDSPIDIQIQSVCAPPRCDAATWTVRPRERIDVPEEFFDAWRAIFALAATRGETWLGKPKEIFLSRAPTGPDS